MKKLTIKFLATLAMASIAQHTLAVEFAVEDISKRVLTCDHSSFWLASAPIGACLAYPDHTLWVTATLEPGEPQELLDNVYVVLQQGDQFHQYHTRSDLIQNGQWHKVDIALLQTATPAIPSYQRAPWETNVVGRGISYEQISGKKGAKLLVGVRSNKSSGFDAKTAKEVYVIVK